MPIYTIPGRQKPILVQGDQMDQFWEKHPDAKLQAEAGGQKYSVSKDEFGYFKEDFPDYKSEIANTYYNSSNQTQVKPAETQGEQANDDKPGFLGSMANRFAAGASEAFGSAANLVNKIAGAHYDAVNYSKGKETNSYQDNPVAQVGKEAKETAEEYRQAGDLYNGKGFTELFKEGHPLDAAGSAFLSATESLPQSLAIAMGGKLGLLAAFGTTASDKYDQLKEEYPEMPEWKAMSNALWTGASEALTEVFGAGTIGRTVKGLLAKGGKKEAADLVKKSFLDKLAKAEEKHWLIMPAVSEFSEESANALSEWAVDKMTGVQRDDNILMTMLDAGMAGAMGGVQFSPVIGAAKFQNNRIKNKVTKEFKQASDQVSGFLPDDQKAILIDGLHQYQVNNDLDNAQKFVDEFSQNMGASQEQYKMIVDLARASVGYNNYVDYVNDQIDQETKKRIDEINILRNPEMGSIVQAKMGEMDDPVYIVGGTLAYKDDMSIDVDNSSDIIYFVDANGKTQQATPQSFSALVNDFPLEQAYNEAYNLAKTDVIQREEAGDASQFAPGQQVMTSNGVAGQVQSIDEEGNVIVNSNGITNVYKPEDLQVMQEQAQPTMQPDVQQEQAPAFPMDKDGNIDFAQISDPQQFADGLKQEFGDGGTAIIDQYIANEQAKLAKTSKAGDPIKSARDKASAQAKLDFYNQVKGAMGTEMGLTGDQNPINPIPQGEEYQSVEEFNANNGISDNPINPINQTENPIEQEAVSGDTQSVDNGIENAPENPTNPTEQEPAKQPTTDDVVADILDGELDDQEVDDYVAENKRAAQNALTVINNKKPKMSTNKAEYLAKRAAWQQEADAAQAEVDRWNEIGAKIVETRKGIGADEAARILSVTEPQNGHELAAKMLADGSIKLTHDSFKKETGGGTGEARGFFGLFARPEKGGVNIERAGEILMLADLEAGTNFFDQNDPNAGRNAIIDVLSEARTRGDLINYIRNNREEQARREQEAQYNAYAQQIMDEYHMSPDEYEAYERLSEEAAKMMSPEQQAEIDGEIYDQIMQEQADEAERMAIFDSLNNNNENGTTETEGDPGTIGGVQEESNGGNEVLPGQQVSDPGRGEVLDKQGDEPVSNNAGQDGGAPKSEAERIKEAESEVDQNPTDAQKIAGNYKKGHLSIKGFDISIENPAGSIRSGVDADGKRWENKMNNTYGYFKGTQSVDGDHIDVYLSNDMDSWSGDNVYVIDQYNPDGSFDEHKVMFGFDNADEALNNFLANYEKGWGETHRLDVTPVSMDGFKKWIDSSHRKTKPFAEYSSIKDKPSVEEQPIQKKWSEMTMDERMKEVETNPLTKEQVEAYTDDDVIKANALAYINGKEDLINSIAYLKVYEDVRNSNGSHTQDNGTKDGTQLAQTDNAVNQTGGLGTRGTGGESAEQMDRGSRTADVSGKRSDVQNGEGRTDTNAGAQGDSAIPVEGKPVVGSDTGSNGREGSGTDSANGRDGKRRGSKTGGTASTDTRSRSDVSQRKGSKGNDQPKTGRKSVKDIEAERKNALDEFNSILDQFVKAGKKDLSLSLAGLNNEQFEILPKLISAGAKVGYTYIQEGIYKLAEWFPKMKSVLRTPLQKVGFSEDEVDSFIKEMWKCNMPIDGVTHTLEEWAAILGEENLRKEVGKSINEKKQLQDQAESIEVKVGDRQNIEETLPYLLPQQRDDVMKAEVQFFDASHNDRDHGNGKGFMFTNGTGTGKTYTGLGIVKRFIKQGKGRVLIVTPSQTKVNDWIKDASNLNIDLRDLDSIAKEKGTTATTEAGEGAVITTFANFRTNKALLESTFDLVVYDESHRILENKSGAGTTGSNQHYMITNRNERYAYDRLWEINPLKKQIEDKFQEFLDEAERIKNNNPSGSDMVGLTLGRLDNNDRASYPKLAEIERQYYDLLTKKETVVDPRLREQAKQEVPKTKVVFLSATPFNTRENLEYAEGYIFSYPEEDKVTAGGYRHKSPRTEFYLQHFGAGYRFRYGHIEAHTKNAEALAKQEVDFSDYLQNELQTMSGRVIDSEYDYSRDFPTVTLGVAERFNEAVQKIKDSDCSHAMYQLLGDYNYSSALFETLKVSCAIPRIKEHLAKGRKVVVFHRRVESKNPIVPLFTAYFESEEAMLKNSLKERPNDVELKAALDQLSQLKDKYKDLLEWESTLDMSMPRAQLANEFGADNVLFFSGKESTKVKNQAVDTFNDDNSGKNIIVIQEASGKEGISLHDRTGEHQRALITLALPQSPITALQIEGRIYRIGNKSNAIFEYPLLGLDAEMILFGQRFNNQVGTTENLALGSKARNLRDSFARGVEERSGYIDPETQGFGGKDFDAPFQTEVSEYDRSVLDYYTNQKIKGRRDNREGLDYYPTPEPLGFKMVEWADIREGDSALEPSAGHGAIARYVPRGNGLTAVEPSSSLFAKLQIKVGGSGRKFVNNIFEQYNEINKHDVVIMNPPFGKAGSTAVKHVIKAFNHLDEGGRLVALIPNGKTPEKLHELMGKEHKDSMFRGEILLPDIVFENAGTKVSCRVVIFDKVGNAKLRQKASPFKYDMSGKYDKVEDFFEDLRDVRVPERIIDRNAILKKRAKSVESDIKENKYIEEYEISDKGIYVNPKRLPSISIYWDGLSESGWESKLLVHFNRFNEWSNEKDERQAEVGSLMKQVVAKLAGKTEDQMERDVNNVRMEAANKQADSPSVQTEQTAAPQNDQSAYVYEKKQHTKTGDDMHMAMPKKAGSLSDDEYSRISKIAKNNGGYWNRFMKGFAFKTKEDADRFIAETMPKGNEGVSYQKADAPGVVSAEEAILRDALSDIVRQSGIEVIDNTEEGQRVLDEANGDARMQAKRRALETVSVTSKKEHQPTVVSSADGANVLKKLDETREKYDNISNRINTFIGDVAKALGATRHNSKSEYATFETKNGRVVTIRLADHNATVSNFDRRGELNGISIVVSPKKNEGVMNNGDAHVVEYYYDAIKLRRADGKPLADIVRSIKQALYSGEFNDTTGIAERQEVNADDIRQQKVYHGSGADFNAFDSSHMGEGEGNQSYGWGTYVTEVEGIARTYAKTNNSSLRKSKLKSDIRRLKEALPFRKGEAKREGEEELKRLEDELSKFYDSWSSVLYTVEIPDNNGYNYLNWEDGPITHKQYQMWYEAMKILGEEGSYANPSKVSKEPLNFDAGSEITRLGRKYSPEDVSKALSKAGFAGISYPAQYRSVGRNDGKHNYVIFNDSDAKITDKVRFFRTQSGEAYGYTVNGKIYIDPRIATSETPIHEYAHIWASAIRKGNPKEWGNIVGLMKGTDIWNSIQDQYPELTSEDEIADEVLAQYSGKRGAAKLRAELDKVAKDNTTMMDKVKAMAAIQNVRDALNKFWKGVADFLHIKYKSAEEVADRVMSDLLNSVNPMQLAKIKNDTAGDTNTRYQFIGEQGASNMDKAEEANIRLDNLSIAREMEKANKDAKSIKLATGWERGADGKWRYEIPDGKFDRSGELHPERRRLPEAEQKELDDSEMELLEAFEKGSSAYTKGITENTDMADIYEAGGMERKKAERLSYLEDKRDRIAKEPKRLDDYLESKELFDAYPYLRETVVDTSNEGDALFGKLGSYDPSTNVLKLNDASHSTLIHEVQHAIQNIEGFESGSNPQYIGWLFNEAKKEFKARRFAEQLEEKRQELGDGYSQQQIHDELVKELSEAGMPYVPRSVQEKAFNYWVRGYANKALDNAIKAFDLENNPQADFDPQRWYKKVGGEVEARNSQIRMNMTPEERRASLASETEDVAREDQVFLADRPNAYDTMYLEEDMDKIVKDFVNPTLYDGNIEAGQSFAESLGVADQVEFVTDKEVLQGKRASAKGFFDRKTGKVTVVVPNHTSVGDMQATILHELVGHYGLRKLFGDKFDDMMDRTFKAMPKELRRSIAEEAISKYRGDVRTATEEYLSSIAERGVRDMKLWEKIKAGIKDFFRSIGINLTMRDEDIAYMLWRSKNRLKASDTMLEVAQKIADNADMQSLLYRDGMGFGSMLNTPKVDRNGVVEISEWLKERLKNRSAQRELYLKVREGYQDNMIRVREWQREVERETGHKVQDHEDFYTFKNQTSSRAQFDMQKFHAECSQVIWNEIDKLAQKIGKPAGEGTRMIENYEMVKHGLERNEYMRQQAIDQLQYQATIDIDNAKATLKGKQLQDAIDKITAKLNNEVAKYENKDYSGLTALSNEILGSDKMDEAALSKWVDDFEKQYDTMPLWKAIREATNRTLQQQLRTGLISKETHDKISGMYKFYIPLKDWDGTRAQDLYEYENGDRDIIQNPLKHAKGRTTRAGNVLANIASAYESATILGYKNLANQRLLNFVRNSGTQSAVASEQWFIKSYDAQGNEYWQPAYASGFNEDPDHNAKVIADFEADMKQKQEQGLAKTVHEVAKLGVPVKAWQEQQHIVKVKEGGVDKTVYFLGDPRVSQAVNGLNNRNYDILVVRLANNVRKFMMLNYTSRNVTFIMRNLLRDITYVSTMNYVKYGKDFAIKYAVWFPKAMKALAMAEYGGKVDPEVENFYKNGGATGYLDSIGYERYKNEIDSLIKASEGKDRLKYLKKIFTVVGMHVERVNNIVENANRYAVYRTAKESGFSELKAIEAAKEASVNFNRRGSGQYGGVIAQNFYFFFNAAIQGTQNFGSAVSNNKGRSLKALGLWFALAAFIRLSGIFGDDDEDEYNQLPDYIRQNNFVVPLWEGQYLNIPLPVEIRAVYGLGDMAAQAVQGGYDGNKMGFVSDALLKLVDLAPISVEIPQGRRTSEEMSRSLLKNFIPDALKPGYDVLATNENFYGKRITGRNDYNSYIPEWQKASYGTSKALIEASKKLNEATGGDYATKGWADNLLTNPSVVEYLFEQYLGGVGKTLGQAYKTVEAVTTGDKVYSRNIPIVSGLTYSTENMVPKDNTSKKYNNYIDDFNEAQSRYKQYQKGVANGEATSEQFTNFVNSPEFMRYQIIGAYKKQVDGINDMRKALDPDDPMNETLAKYALETKRQMIERLKEMEE